MKLILLEQKTFYNNLYTSKINKTESYIESENSFFMTVFCKEPKSHNEIVNQFLVYNKSIRINNKYLHPDFFKSDNLKHTYNIRILNMLNPQNIFLDIQGFNDSNNTNITILEYNTLKSCIPKAWKSLPTTYKKFADTISGTISTDRKC